MVGRKLGFAVSSFLVGLTLLACSAADEASESSNSAIVAKNLCVGQDANTFHCIDDTSFELCTGGDRFVVESCPKGFCATRHPANKNPCIGAERAKEIDGVAPTPPNQIDDSPAAGNGGNTNTGAANNANNNTGANNNNNTGAANNNTGAANNTGNVNTGANGATCVGGPKFDPAGAKNVGNGHGGQFIGGQCLSAADCASGCCALPCGICSGPGAQFQAGKQGCGFVAH